MNVSVKTEAVSRANNHGTQVSESIVDAGVRAAPSAEGLSVVEQPKLDEMPAEACSDEIKLLKETVSRLEIQKGSWVAVAERYECYKPFELIEYIEYLHARIASLEANKQLPLYEVDMVNSPPHYQGKVECIDAIESALGPVGFVAYCRGNAMKYTFRAGRKGDYSEDLAKAKWYLDRASHA